MGIAVQTTSPAATPPAAMAAASSAAKRLAREWKTLETMIHLYCRDQHPGSFPCAECRRLAEYARARLDRCRFGAEKPTCANCPVHCYQRARRDQIKAVMRYAGPRMLWRHPVMSLCYWLNGVRKASARDFERRSSGVLE